jgi:hypothetical protein
VRSPAGPHKRGTAGSPRPAWQGHTSKSIPLSWRRDYTR